MPHDFDPNPGNCRVDKNGKNCCQKGSVMDYHQVILNFVNEKKPEMYIFTLLFQFKIE